MALEACPNCSRPISLDAAICPKCGQPLQVAQWDQARARRKRNWKRFGISAAGIAVLLATCSLLVPQNSPTTKRFSEIFAGNPDYQRVDLWLRVALMNMGIADTEQMRERVGNEVHRVRIETGIDEMDIIDCLGDHGKELGPYPALATQACAAFVLGNGLTNR